MYAIRSYYVAFFFSALFSSCNKKDEPVILPVMPDIQGTYLVEYTSLGTVSVNTIKLMLQLAGYDYLSHYMRYSIRIYKLVYHTTYNVITSYSIHYTKLYEVGKSESVPYDHSGNGISCQERVRDDT